MALVLSVLEQGLIYAILALGIYITYKILDFPDLTVDSSFPLGAAVCVVMIKAGISKALTAQTVEQFKAGHGPGICNGYDIYCGICEAIFLAQSNGMGAKALTDLEEMVSRCLTYRFHEYDIPGTILY